jgi:hypothetical protein
MVSSAIRTFFSDMRRSREMLNQERELLDLKEKDLQLIPPLLHLMTLWVIIECYTLY